MIEPLTCRDVALLLTEYLERAIPWNQRMRTRLHLRLCPGCNRLLSDIEALPAIFQKFDQQDAVQLLSIGEGALANALARLNEPRKSWRFPEKPVPDGAKRLLSAEADLPLQVLALAHSALLKNGTPAVEPYLPNEVMEKLPPVQTWKWKQSPSGVRKALLWAKPNGPSLSVLVLPPHHVIPSHTHQGSESLLVLNGELEHADRCLTHGDWIHLESGSSHSSCAFDRGCWCLVREEGRIRYDGPFGWASNLVGRA